MKERRYDIDWLRVLVMLAVFFFHCARFFGGGRWHLNNDEESIVAYFLLAGSTCGLCPCSFFFLGLVPGTRYTPEVTGSIFGNGSNEFWRLFVKTGYTGA
ncbi:MAG: hypothetical protein R3A44_37610 [Caldilineaceae bacterium]